MNSFHLFCALIAIIGLGQVMLCSGLRCYDCQYIMNIKRGADSGSSTCERRPSIVELTEFSDTPGLKCLSKKSCLFETILKVSGDYQSQSQDQELLSPAVDSVDSDGVGVGVGSHYCITLTGKFQDLDVVFRGSVWMDVSYGNNFCLNVPSDKVEGFVDALICGCNQDGCNNGGNNGGK